nr:MAG TPA: hypothetical protein [Crassvirales sp.]
MHWSTRSINTILTSSTKSIRLIGFYFNAYSFCHSIIK